MFAVINLMQHQMIELSIMNLVFGSGCDLILKKSWHFHGGSMEYHKNIARIAIQCI
jgi:hypothetical protein